MRPPAVLWRSSQDTPHPPQIMLSLALAEDTVQSSVKRKGLTVFFVFFWLGFIFIFFALATPGARVTSETLISSADYGVRFLQRQTKSSKYSTANW